MSICKEFGDKTHQIIKAGRFLDQNGWVPATSSNFSMRLSDNSLALTVSGYHKGELSEEALMRIDADGQPMDDEDCTPSAETLLHTALYKRFAEVGAVLHTHSVNATVLSRICKGQLEFEDYELQKAFKGVETHEGAFIVPIFENDQNIPRLVEVIERYLDQHPNISGYLIAGHGLYTWGETMRDALRHIEAFEFLFACEVTTRSLMR